MTLRSVRILIIIGAYAVSVGASLMIFLRPGNYPAEGLIVIVLFMLLNADAVNYVLSKSDVQQSTLVQNADFRRGYVVWFRTGLVFFLVANVVGTSPGKMRFPGFPVTFWPTFGHDDLAVLALSLDMAFALAHSHLLGLAMAFRRTSTKLAVPSNPM